MPTTRILEDRLIVLFVLVNLNQSNLTDSSISFTSRHYCLICFVYPNFRLSGTMAPNVAVPMNFGIRLLDSPTHSTLELKASQGAVIPASSVILSFNSPVIDHMTTTLHLISVDMEEFSEDAVRYFVDAAYSGESPPICRVLFRDINKLANVFEMSWLATKCNQQFTDIAATICDPSYEDLFFLFEEAAFVLTQLKSREMVEIAFTKIQSLNGQQDFISTYLKNLSCLTCKQLDLIIELAGSKVEFVVKPLTEQLTASLSKGETVVPGNCKYLLDNCELYLCHQRNIKMFDQLFDVLENITKESLTETKWTLQLLRKSVVKREKQSKSLAGSSTSIYLLGGGADVDLDVKKPKSGFGFGFGGKRKDSSSSSDDGKKKKKGGFGFGFGGKAYVDHYVPDVDLNVKADTDIDVPEPEIKVNANDPGGDIGSGFGFGFGFRGK